MHSESFHCMEVLLSAQPQGMGEGPWTHSLPPHRQNDIDLASLRATNGIEGGAPTAVSSPTRTELKDKLDLAENGQEETIAPFRNAQNMLNPTLVHANFESQFAGFWDAHAWNSASTNNTSSDLSVAMTKGATSTPTVASPALSLASSGDDRRIDTGAKWSEALKGFVSAVKSGSACDVTGVTAGGAPQIRGKETRRDVDLPISPDQSMSSFVGSAPSTPQTPHNLEIAVRHSLFRNGSIYAAVPDTSSIMNNSFSPYSLKNGDGLHAEAYALDSSLPGLNLPFRSARVPAGRLHEFVIDC